MEKYLPMAHQGLRKTFLVYLILFISGATALSYEVLWTRILALSFGHTVYAVTTVLSAFMGGLALGSYYFGRVADRLEKPLLLYAALEIAIGLYCLVAPTLLSFGRHVYLHYYPALPNGPVFRILFQFLLAFAVLCIPTFFMGGTLPAVTRALVAHQTVASRKLALLYGTNTLGAGAGAFAAGYYLLPALGIRMTNYLSAGTTIFIGIALLVLGQTFSPGKTTEITVTEAKVPASGATGDSVTNGMHDNGTTFPHPTTLAALEKALLWASALSGAAAMAYQIVWVRTLVLVIGSSTYAFSAILVTFLVGIALGSFLFSRLKNAGTVPFFAALQAGIGLLAFLLIPFFSVLPRLFLVLFKDFQGNYNYILFVQFLIVSSVVFLPTILMGMTLPCLVGIVNRHIGRLGTDVGRIYAFNTTGAILGSIAAGFLLVPWIGAQRTLVLTISLNVLLACTALILVGRLARTALIPVVIGLAILLVKVPAWNRNLMVSGVSIYPDHLLSRLDGPGTGEFPQPEILYFREGISSTVAVTRNEVGEKSLSINGKAAAGTRSNDMQTFSKLAYIPLLLHPAPRKIAIVGLGSGMTAGFATMFKEPDHIDIIELEPAVVEASRFFSEENFNLGEGERVRIITEDGRTFLEGTNEYYDVVISQPSNPWIAGVANLFTTEFIQAVRDKLTPSGIFCMWVQGYLTPPEDLKIVIRTFREVFPGATLWEGAKSDYILIGRMDESKTIGLETILSHFKENPGLWEAFGRYNDRPVEGLLTSFRLTRKELGDLAGPGTRNTDDLPILEYRAPRSLYKDTQLENAKEVFRFKRESFPGFINDPDLMAPETHILLGRYLLDKQRPFEAILEFSKAPSRSPQAIPLLEQDAGGDRRAVRPDPVVTFDFDSGTTGLPFFPAVGPFRPEAARERDFSYWAAFMTYFTRTSGIIGSGGRRDSPALTLNGIKNIRYASYFIPLQASPSTTYRVVLWSKNRMMDDRKAGIGIFEYDVAESAGEQFTGSFNERHRLHSTDLARIGRSDDWAEYSLVYTTSSAAKMVYLVFYREGDPTRGSVLFDDIRIEQVSSSS